MDVFNQIESNVRFYSLIFPDVFEKAKGAILTNNEGKCFIDFFAGAGSLNYGHNHDVIKKKILEYIEADGIVQGLDMKTTAKKDFITKFRELVLIPRGLDYKIQFCSPSGTNGVEAALKLACKVTGRSGMFSFMGNFHGMTLGSLSVTSNQYHRQACGIPLPNVTFLPFESGYAMKINSIEYLKLLLDDTHSGVSKPAAIILETIQAEGGVNVASVEWLRLLREVCDQYGILLICDDIQVGCGRTGTFFSFERAGIVPDIVILSKSIGGYGLPMTIVLCKSDLDVWKPGEHSGTFRGNQLAFVGASTALQLREDLGLEEKVREDGLFIEEYLKHEILPMNDLISIRGLGMIWGIDLSKIASEQEVRSVLTECYNQGLIIECAGRKDLVIKIMPPLIIERENLVAGLEILKKSLALVIKDKKNLISVSVN